MEVDSFKAQYVAFPLHGSDSNPCIFLELHDEIWQSGDMNRSMKKEIMLSVRGPPPSRRKKRSE